MKITVHRAELLINAPRITAGRSRPHGCAGSVSAVDQCPKVLLERMATAPVSFIAFTNVSQYEEFLRRESRSRGAVERDPAEDIGLVPTNGEIKRVSSYFYQDTTTSGYVLTQSGSVEIGILKTLF